MNRIIKILIVLIIIPAMWLIQYPLMETNTSWSTFSMLVTGAGLILFLLANMVISLVLYFVISRDGARYIPVIYQGTFYLSVPYLLICYLLKITPFSMNMDYWLMIWFFILMAAGAAGGILSFVTFRKKEMEYWKARSGAESASSNLPHKSPAADF